MSPTPSPPDLLVLLGVRLKGVAEVEALTVALALDEVTVAATLAAHETAGWVRRREGRLTGWALMPAGRVEGERRLADELDRAGARERLRQAYDRFRRINHEFLVTCTDWQQVEPGVLNDHSDQGYDEAVVARLARLHDEVVPICDDLRSIFVRFDSYPIRFTRALARVQAGDTDWFLRPLVDSYHTVWFELHEHLLASLGLDRATETQTQLAGQAEHAQKMEKT